MILVGINPPPEIATSRSGLNLALISWAELAIVVWISSSGRIDSVSIQHVGKQK